MRFCHSVVSPSFKSCDSSVSIVLSYGLGNQGSRVWFLAGAGKFSLHHHIQNGSGAHPGSYPMGTSCSFPECKADHSPPSSAEVKECVELTFTSQYAFMAWYLLKESTGSNLPLPYPWVLNFWTVMTVSNVLNFYCWQTCWEVFVIHRIIFSV
jgi:hypothetical protein